MSRIFDALQRSQKERPETDQAAPPEGPELLKRVERRAATRWIDSGSVKEFPVAADAVRDAAQGTALADAPAPTGPVIVETLSRTERERILGQFPSLPMALSANSRLVCHTDRESPTAEALRLLAVRLRDLRRIKPLKRVLITSTIPQEGKSTIASNLAYALAHAGEERVLLVEGDLRRPSLARLFGVHPKSGICDSLRAQKSPLESVYRIQDAGLWMWPAGSAPGNPLEVLQSPMLLALMNQWAAYFDWIIIDSPPVLPLADTSVWMRLADGVLLVTRQGTTEKKQLQKGLEALPPEKTLGALVNGAAASAYSGYYYRTSGQPE